MRSGLLTAASVPLTTSTGCATLLDLLSGVVKKPDLSLKSFDIKKASLTSLSVSLVALLKNPNPFGFKLDGLDWLVGLAGGQVAKGRAPKGLTLKAKGSAEQQLDMDFDLAKTTAALLELVTNKKVPLKVDAVGKVSANKYKFDIPAKYETSVPMPTMPKFDVPRFAIKSANASGVKFTVEPLVKNSNNFDIDIDNFKLDIKLNGRSAVSNKSIKNLKVQKGKSERVPLDFTVSLVDIGLSVAQLATNPNLDWQVDADLVSGFLKLPFNEKGKVRLS